MLKKLAIITEQAQASGSPELITYKDNLINNAIQFLETKYPWLPPSPAIELVEMKPKEGFSYGIGTVTFPNSSFILQFPIIFSDGEFLEIPAFYSPENKLFLPFNEDWLKLVSDNLGDDIPMGKLINHEDQSAGSILGFEDNDNSALADSPVLNPYSGYFTKYNSMASRSLLSLIPERYLKRMLKTATAKHPAMISALRSAISISELKYNSKVAKLNKKANKVISGDSLFNPAPVFTKMSQLIDLPDSFAEKHGIDKYAMIESLNKYSYATLDKNVFDYASFNKERVIPESMELKDSGQIIGLLRNMRLGRFTVIQDAVKDRMNIFINPVRYFDHGALRDQNLDQNPKANSEVIHPMPSYNEINLTPRDHEINRTVKDYLVNILGFSRKHSIIKEIFSEDLTFEKLKSFITEVAGEFTTNKIYSGANNNFNFPILYGKKIYNSVIPPRYFKIEVIDRKNGMLKIAFVDYTDDTLNSEKEESGLVSPKKPYCTMLFDKDGSINKIKMVDDEAEGSFVFNAKVEPIKILDYDKVDLEEGFSKTFIKFKPDTELYKFIIRMGTDFNEGELDSIFGDANDIIHASFQGIPITVKHNDSDAYGQYEVILHHEDYVHKVPLKVATKADVGIILGSIGLKNDDISEIIKQAEMTDDYTIGIKPNENFGKKSEETELKLIDEQLKIMFEFMKNKFEEIDKGIEDKDALLAKQLELFEKKLDSIEQLKSELDSMGQSLGDTFNAMSQPAAQEATPAPQAAAPTGPTIDDPTAQMLAQAILDPGFAQQSGIDQPTLELIASAMAGDPAALQQSGMTDADLQMVSQYIELAQQQPPAAPAPMAAPAPAPMQDPAQTQQIAEMLAMGLVDPNSAAQNGLTPEDLEYARQIVANPEMAMQQGEDPNLVQALMDAYTRLSQGAMMQGAEGVATGTPMPSPTLDAMAPAADAIEAGGGSEEAEVMRSMSTLVDLIPKVKSSKLFFKYIKNFKEMLSILGELLFSIEIQSSKYKKLLGEDAYSDTIYLLQDLYKQFGDLILRFYTIEK